MAMGRSGLGVGLALVGALVSAVFSPALGCGAQPLAPARDAGMPMPSVSRPGATPADASAPAGSFDAATTSGAVDAAVSRRGVDGATRPASVDAASEAGPTVHLARTTLLTDADLSAAEVLAADEDGIYWVTGENQLWMLPAGSEAPRRLAADPNPPLDPTD